MRALVGVSVLLLAGPALGDMTVEGEFRYEDRAYAFSGWTGQWPELPVRLAEVLVLDAQTGEVLASGWTGQDGSYAIPVAGSGVRDLVVRCSTVTALVGPDFARVWGGGAEAYSVSSPVFEAQSLSLDLDAGVVIAERMTSGSVFGSPFSAFDQMVRAFEYVASLGTDPDPTPFEIYWPAESTFAGRDLVWLKFQHSYSDPLVLHELGHTMDARYSEPDTSGGSHSFGQSDQFPSLSLSEGFATYFNGAVRLWDGDDHPGFYFEGTGLPSTGMSSVLLRADLETRAPWTQLTAGEADELAVAAALWNVADTVDTPDGEPGDDDLVDGSFLFSGGLRGDELVWAGMRSSTVRTADPVHVIDLLESFLVDLEVQRGPELQSAFTDSEIRVFQDGNEPNDRPAEATLLLPSDEWSEIHTLWSAADRDELGRGDVDVYEVPLQGGHVYRFQTRYPSGTPDAESYVDPMISIRDLEGGYLGTDYDSGVGRNPKEELAVFEDTTWRLEVFAQGESRPTGAYQVRVRDLGPVPAPAVASVSPETLVTVEPGYPTSIMLTGTGFVGVTSVTVGGVPADFWLVDDERLGFGLPQTNALGTHEVVVSGPQGSDSISLDVVAPETPTLSAGGTYWQPSGVTVWFGGDPGDAFLLYFSFSDVPTSVPGLVDLDLGAGGTSLWLVAGHETGGSGWVALDFPLQTEVEGFVDVWLQAAVLSASDPGGPLATTNLVKGILQ